MEWLILAIGGLSFFLSYLYGAYETVGKSLPVMPIEFLLAVVSVSMVAMLWKLAYPKFEFSGDLWKSRNGKIFLFFLGFGVLMVLVHGVAKHLNENVDMASYGAWSKYVVEQLHMSVSHTAVYFSAAALLWILSEFEVRGSMRLIVPVKKRKVLYLGGVLLGYSLYKAIVHYGSWGWQEIVYPVIALRVYRVSKKNSIRVRDAVVVPLTLIVLTMVAVLLILESKIL